MPLYECRFHYGMQNEGVVERTDGKPCHKHPRLATHNSVTMLEAPRDHPRMVAGPMYICRAYGGNCDSQLILAPDEDIQEDIFAAAGDSIVEKLISYMQEQNLDAGERKVLQEIRSQRSYTNRDEYAERVCDYVVAYACESLGVTQSGVHLHQDNISQWYMIM